MSSDECLLRLQEIIHKTGMRPAILYGFQGVPNETSYVATISNKPWTIGIQEPISEKVEEYQLNQLNPTYSFIS